MKKYLIYGLVDPRNNKICYIGMTSQKLKIRLRQHNNPKKDNLSKIAKLSRFLNKNKLKFSIVELYSCLDEQDMFEKEILFIKEYREKGYLLKNIQPGGLICDNSYSSSSILRTSNKLKEYYNKNIHKKGQDLYNSLFTDKEIIFIYKLIKDFYSNEEILKELNYKCKISAIKAIRTGSNWKHLWNKNFEEPIFSIKTEKNGYSPRIKLKILDEIENGVDLNHISQKYKLLKKSDIKRICLKKLWTPVWILYYKFYKAPIESNFNRKPSEFGENLYETIPSQADITSEGVTTIP